MIEEYSKVIGRSADKVIGLVEGKGKHVVIGIAVDVDEVSILIEEDETNDLYSFSAHEVEPYREK